MTTTAASTTVGVELELFPIRAADGRVAPIAETAPALDGLPWVAFEPGGQVELNPPPHRSWSGAVRCVEQLRAEAARRLAGVGIGLVATGLSTEDVPLQLTSERYRCMDAHYAAIGPAGRVFMRQTASTQIGIGLLAEPDREAQWQAANLVAPLLAAAFANSARLAVLAAADPARHRLRWARRPFAEAYGAFAAGAAPIGNEDHRSTLFPPVRPRDGYLEVRAIDSLGPPALAAAVELTATLLSTPTAVDAVLARLECSDDADDRRWRGDGSVAAEIRTLLDIAGWPPSLPARHLVGAAAEEGPDGGVVVVR